jgi:hypothetical protein
VEFNAYDPPTAPFYRGGYRLVGIGADDNVAVHLGRGIAKKLCAPL